MDKNNTRQRGYRGEDIAAQYLEEHGFRIVARNYYYDRCETDIIAEDGKYLLFAEVRLAFTAEDLRSRRGVRVLR